MYAPLPGETLSIGVPESAAVVESVVAGKGVGYLTDVMPSKQTEKLQVQIRYCAQCRWLLRAARIAQEFLTTFQDELGEVALAPGDSAVFEVSLDGELVFSRRDAGRFLESKELKQLVRRAHRT